MSFRSDLFPKIYDYLGRVYPELLEEKRDTSADNEQAPDYHLFKQPVDILHHYFQNSNLINHPIGCAVVLLRLFNVKCEPNVLAISKYCHLARELFLTVPSEYHSDSRYCTYRKPEVPMQLWDLIREDSQRVLKDYLHNKTAEQLVDLLEDAARWQVSPKMKDKEFKCPQFASYFRPLEGVAGIIIEVLVDKKVQHEEVAESWYKFYKGGLAVHLLRGSLPQAEVTRCSKDFTNPETLRILQNAVLSKAFGMLPMDVEIRSMDSTIRVSSEILRFSWEYFNYFLKYEKTAKEGALTRRDANRGIKYKIDLGRRLTPDTLTYLRSYFYRGFERYEYYHSLPYACLAKFGEELRLFDPNGTEALDKEIKAQTAKYPETAEIPASNYVYALVWGLENDVPWIVEFAIARHNKCHWQYLDTAQNEWILGQPKSHARLSWMFLIGGKSQGGTSQGWLLKNV